MLEYLLCQNHVVSKVLEDGHSHEENAGSDSEKHGLPGGGTGQSSDDDGGGGDDGDGTWGYHLTRGQERKNLS